MQLQARGLLLSATQAATGHMAQSSHEAAALCAAGWLHAPWACLAMYAAHNNTWAGLWAGMCCSRLSSTKRHATIKQTGHVHCFSKLTTYVVLWKGCKVRLTRLDPCMTVCSVRSAEKQQSLQRSAIMLPMQCNCIEQLSQGRFARNDLSHSQIVLRDLNWWHAGCFGK